MIDPKVILDDARARDAGWLALMLATDRQAMDLFRIYVTLGTAVSSGFVAGLVNGYWGDAIYPVVALGAMLMLLAAACLYCMRALTPAEITLPGRAADFWMWHTRTGVSDADALNAYLEYAETAQTMNANVNRRNSTDLYVAKKLGLMAFAAATIIAVVGWQSP